MNPSAPNDETFESVYRRLAPAVLGYLRAKGLDDPEAVMQDVFVSALPKIGNVSGGEEGVRSLVFSIAHARAVDFHRHRLRAGTSVEYDPELDDRLTVSAEEIAVATAANERTVAILASLSDDHREVILLRVVGDLPLREVAKIMGRSVGSIKQLQRRALRALSQHPDVREGRFE